jgi:hypothetical protein
VGKAIIELISNMMESDKPVANLIEPVEEVKTLVEDQPKVEASVKVVVFDTPENRDFRKESP